MPKAAETMLDRLARTLKAMNDEHIAKLYIDTLHNNGYNRARR